MGWFTDSFRFAGEGFSEIRYALEGKEIEELRCSECDFRHVREVEEGVWECPQCGIVDVQVSGMDIRCPGCGRQDLEIDMEHGIVECPSCGVMDDQQLEYIADLLS